MLWGMTYRVEIHVTKGLSPRKILLGLTAVYFWASCRGRLRKAIAMGRVNEWDGGTQTPGVPKAT